MDEKARLHDEIVALRTELAAHVASLKAKAFLHRPWLAVCAVALVIGAALGRWVL